MSSVKVRPDVSREEYNAYQAFKYDKDEDYNPFDDGNFSIGGGALRGTSDGIHGAELQFLGRSLPATTAGIPYATALAGTVAGAVAGRRERQGCNRWPPRWNGWRKCWYCCRQYN